MDRNGIVIFRLFYAKNNAQILTQLENLSQIVYLRGKCGAVRGICFINHFAHHYCADTNRVGTILHHSAVVLINPKMDITDIIPILN